MIDAAAQVGKLYAELVTGQPRPEIFGVLDRSKKGQGAGGVIVPSQAVHKSTYSTGPHTTAELKIVERGNPQSPTSTINELNRVGEKIVGALDAPAIGKVPPLKTSLVFPQTFVFQFPYRKDDSCKWKLHKFVMLKGTEVTYTVTSKDLGDRVERSVTLDFSGDSNLNAGFWGPFHGKMKKSEPFPELRIDRMVVNEEFDKATGQAVAFHDIEDYEGNDHKLPYRIDLVLSMHNQETGRLKGCSGIVKRFIGAKCVETDGGEAYQMDMSRKIYSIFNNMPTLTIRSEIKGGVVAEAKEFYSRLFGTPLKNANSLKSVSLALMMWYLWREGAKLATYQVDHFPRIGKMEEKL